MKKKIIIIFMLLALLISTFVNVSSITIDNLNDNNAFNDNTRKNSIRNMVRDSNNNLHVVYTLKSGGHWDLYYAKSTNNGLSWSNKLLVDASYSVQIADLIIDEYDKIYCLFFENDTSNLFKVNLITSNNLGSTWSSNYTIFNHNENYDTDDSADLCIDSNNNIYCTYIYETNVDQYIKMKKYNYDVGDWNSAFSVWNTGEDIWNMETEVVGNYICFIYNRNNMANDIELRRYDLDTMTNVETERLWDANDNTNKEAIEFSTCNDGTYIHIAYTRENTSDIGVYYNKYNVQADTLSDEVEIFYDSSYNQYTPSISINTNGYIHILWHGNNWEMSNKIFYKYYDTGSWSDFNVACSGSGSFVYPIVLFQRFPDFMRLNSGFLGTFFNSSTNNFEFFTSDTYSWYTGGSGGTGGTGLEQYAFIGSDYKNNAECRATNNNYIEIGYFVERNINTHGLDLFLCLNNIYKSMAIVDESAFLNLFSLSLNGDYKSKPSDYIDYGDYQVLRWEFNSVTEINNEIIKIELKTYLDAWQYLVGISNEDLDNDGQVVHFQHDSSTQHGNNNLDGSPFQRDVYYKLYYSGEEYINITNPFNPDNNEGVDPDTGYAYGFNLDVYNYIGYEHPTYGIPYYYNYTNCVIGYTVGNLSDNYYIHIYDNLDNEVGQSQGHRNQKYPKLIKNWGGVFGFVPFNIGYYNITIEDSDDNEIRRQTIYVANNILNYNIYSIPNPSRDNEGYGVGAWFINGNDIDGLLACFKYPDEINDIDKAIYTRDIQDGEHDIYTFQPSYLGNYYWQLFINRSGTYLPIGSTYVHICMKTGIELGLIEMFDLNIDDPQFTYLINEYTPESEIQKLYTHEDFSLKFHNYSFYKAQRFYIGNQHVFPFADIYAEIDNYDWGKDIGQYYRWCWGHKDTRNGRHKVDLIFKINNQEFVLDTKYYDISNVPEGYYDTETGILPPLETTLGYIVGLIATMFLLLMPLIITKGLHARQQPPALVYAFSGGIGIAISVLFGWFPTWIIAFIILIGVIISFLTYIRGQGKGE